MKIQASARSGRILGVLGVEMNGPDFTTAPTMPFSPPSGVGISNIALCRFGSNFSLRGWNLAMSALLIPYRTHKN